MSSYVTSNSLIESIKNRALIPTNQVTFDTDAFLRFANEEMKTTLTALLIRVHEEYLTKQVAVTLNSSNTVYEIPYRAVGTKLRDLAVLDGSKNYYSLTKVDPEHLADFPTQGSGLNSNGFYIIDNTVNLLGTTPGGIGPGQLVFTFYMRPNNLVREERVCRINAVTKTSSLTFSSGDVSTSLDQITINSHGLSSGVSVVFTGGSLPSPLVSGEKYFISAVNSNSIQLFLDQNLTNLVDLTTTGSGTLAPNCFDIGFATSSTVFTSSSLFDITQDKSPHKILHFDLPPVLVSSNFVRFRQEDLAYPLLNKDGSTRYDMPKINDIIALAGETIIPQLPDELHTILAQCVAARCLEALGDREGLQAANQKLALMISDAIPLIDSRVESAPQVIVNNKSPLRNRTFGNRVFRS